ncbi:MAG: histidine kinase [Sphingobacteriales bacterium]|nr:MAG: histidine kinase [Sphingobacteriales bacterium]
MLQDYIQHRLRTKNRSIYFKKGKWIFHLLCIVLIWWITYIQMKPVGGQAPPGAGWVALLGQLPFLGFFYYYCLYLIPVCFKQNQYRRFWTILLVLLAIVPWIEAALQISVFRRYPLRGAETLPVSGWRFVWMLYRDFGTAFLGFTVVLFFMELTEGIRTTQEMAMDHQALAQTEVQVLKTRMDPAFMTRSLEAIRTLAETNSSQAPEAVVQFADILRYRLYRSSQPQVLLAEELAQLRKLFQLYQTQRAGDAILDVEGELPEAFMTPLLLLNLAESALTLLQEDPTGTVLFYLLAEPDALHIAVEITTVIAPDAVVLQFRTLETELSRLAGMPLQLTTELTSSNVSIHLCLPLQNPLPA